MKKSTPLFSLICLCFLLQGCSYNTNSSPVTWLNNYKLSYPTDSKQFRLCTNFGCSQQRQTSFSSAELSQIGRFFQPPANSAELERRYIAKAIGLMEKLQGPKINTTHDLGKNQFSFRHFGGQLDCVAETSNTTIYLSLLTEQGWIRFHRLGGNAHRGPFTLSAPHNSAVIIEQGSNQAYVVDSWFFDNGQPAWIIEVEEWMAGASP